MTNRIVSRIDLLVLLALISAWVTGCMGIGAEPVGIFSTITPTNPSQEITVAAAADLQFAFQDIAALFEKETGCEVNLVFGSTGQLVQQIENGAPYDLIASANIEYVDRLAEQDLVIPDSIALYAQGRITIAVNKDSGIDATTLNDLLKEDIRHIAIANPDHAPYGLAAKQALISGGVWESVQDKIVYAENIRQALQYVQSGDAQAGIIALSVANVPEVTWTLLDDSLHEPLDQALAVIASSPNPRLASQFAQYVTSEPGGEILLSYGFVLPGQGPDLQIFTTP